MDTASKVKANVLSVSSVMDLNLQIPHYQRPYEWNEINVRQLLDDIWLSQCSGKLQYWIGSIIFHKNDQNFDIVDGQQRLTTLALVERNVESNNVSAEKALCNKLTYHHNISKGNICTNYKSISDWFSDNGIDKETYWAYIKNNCKFVVIEITDLSEAFQMFDTQNGRGKSLEAYNLLKAYHIRAMELNTQEEKINCDRRWESAIQYDATPNIQNDPNINILGQLFAEQLYRSRIWCKKDSAGTFSRKNIDEFKGITVDKNHPIKFPFQNSQLLQYLTTKFYNNILAGTIGTQSRFAGGDSENIKII